MKKLRFDILSTGCRTRYQLAARRELTAARAMLAACQQVGMPLFVRENWRWQTALRALKRNESAARATTVNIADAGTKVN